MKSVCTACRLVFSSVSAFDMHRVGPYNPPGRRCLTDREMLNKGMVRNNRGVWTTGEFWAKPDDVMPDKFVAQEDDVKWL